LVIGHWSLVIGQLKKSPRCQLVISANSPVIAVSPRKVKAWVLAPRL
jgi:hypothetical protein